MQELNVQIERLEPMHVAAIAITSEAPEEEAINALLDWARPQGLLNGPFRFIGYDNCQPPPNHTYTTWLTVGHNVEPSGNITITDFSGGLFATVEVQGVEQIGPTWDRLEQWLKASDYDFGGHPGLEEHMDILSDQPRRFKLFLSLKD
jgi:DNA gyrase inhibitor GyrI